MQHYSNMRLRRSSTRHAIELWGGRGLAVGQLGVWTKRFSNGYLDSVSAGQFLQNDGPLQLPLVQLPHVHVVQLLQARGDQQSVICGAQTGSRSTSSLEPREEFGRSSEAGGLTVDELPLLLDDLVAQVSVLLEALHHEVLLSDDAVLQQRVRLNLRVLDLQLVDLAEEAQDLALLVCAHPPVQQLLLPPGLVPQLQEPALQQHLERRRGGGGEGTFWAFL